MQAFVLDVSACMPWCCEDEASETSEQMLEWAMKGSTLHVPSLWPWEMLNVVAVVVRRGRISAEHGRDFLLQLTAFDIRTERVPAIADFGRLYALAQRHSLTAYDVAYLDLEKRLALPLASRDTDLIQAAQAEGVSVL